MMANSPDVALVTKPTIPCEPPEPGLEGKFTVAVPPHTVPGVVTFTVSVPAPLIESLTVPVYVPEIEGKLDGCNATENAPGWPLQPAPPVGVTVPYMRSPPAVAVPLTPVQLLPPYCCDAVIVTDDPDTVPLSVPKLPLWLLDPFGGAA